MLAFSASHLVLLMGLGVQELLIIFLAIVFLFGAKKIPDIARCQRGRRRQEKTRLRHQGGRESAERLSWSSDLTPWRNPLSHHHPRNRTAARRVTCGAFCCYW